MKKSEQAAAASQPASNTAQTAEGAKKPASVLPEQTRESLKKLVAALKKAGGVAEVTPPPAPATAPAATPTAPDTKAPVPPSAPPQAPATPAMPPAKTEPKPGQRAAVRNPNAPQIETGSTASGPSGTTGTVSANPEAQRRGQH
jgi:hypothetical protein